jgi:hypothetical protein
MLTDRHYLSHPWRSQSSVAHQFVRTSPIFGELEGSLVCSHVRATGPYPNPISTRSPYSFIKCSWGQKWTNVCRTGLCAVSGGLLHLFMSSTTHGLSVFYSGSKTNVLVTSNRWSRFVCIVSVSVAIKRCAVFLVSVLSLIPPAKSSLR